MKTAEYGKKEEEKRWLWWRGREVKQWEEPKKEAAGEEEEIRKQGRLLFCYPHTCEVHKSVCLQKPASSRRFVSEGKQWGPRRIGEGGLGAGNKGFCYTDWHRDNNPRSTNPVTSHPFPLCRCACHPIHFEGLASARSYVYTWSTNRVAILCYSNSLQGVSLNDCNQQERQRSVKLSLYLSN
jgi:hypothetical protein